VHWLGEDIEVHFDLSVSLSVTFVIAFVLAFVLVLHHLSLDEILLLSYKM